MKRRANVIGVGMIEFTKPGASEDYHVMASKAGRAALLDAGVAYDEVQQGYAGYVYGDSTCGQRAFYELGFTGIPVFNVNNNCSTGSSALMLGRQAIEGGIAECVLVVGFEQMERGALASKWDDRTNPIGEHAAVMGRVQGFNTAPITAQMFGGAAREYRWRHGTKRETFAAVASKARAHAARNPFAIFKEPLTVEDVLASPEVFDPLTRFQCCPPTCGAAAVVLSSDDFAKKKGIASPVYIAGQSMKTDFAAAFRDSMIEMVGFSMSKAAATETYEQAGVGPEDVDVLELHDCFSANEVLTYEALGLCPEGGAEKLIEDGDNTFGGRWVTNPSGGLLSKGHPLGATGVAQCVELVWQLRGAAGARQVEGARVALQHNLGLGGACVVTMYRRD